MQGQKMKAYSVYKQDASMCVCVSVSVRVRVRVRACMRACVRACVRACMQCVRACVRACACECSRVWMLWTRVRLHVIVRVCAYTFCN